MSQTQKEANARYIYDYLFERKWSKEAICGLLGNIQRESVMNPGAWESFNAIANDRGYGLVQWTPPTKFLDSSFASALDNYSGTKADKANAWTKSDPKDIMNAQLECIIWECLPTTHSDYREWWPNKAQSYYNKLPLQQGVPGNMSFADYISSTHNAGDLALVFHATYLRSGDNATTLQQRFDNANVWYAYFK